MSNHQPPTTRHVLDNGLTLLIQENRFNQTVAISGRLKAAACMTDKVSMGFRMSLPICSQKGLKSGRGSKSPKQPNLSVRA